MATDVQPQDDDSWLYGDKKSEGTGSQDGGSQLSAEAEPFEPVATNEPSDSVAENTPQLPVVSQSSGVEDIGDAVEENKDDSDDDSDDDVQVVIGDIKANTDTPKFKGYQRPAAKVTPAKGIDIDAVGSINGTPIYDFDLTKLDTEEKPWRKPGADITDYFNYGFTEDTWMLYCDKQKRLRAENGVLQLTPRTGFTPKQTKPVTIKPPGTEDTPKSEDGAFLSPGSAAARKAGPPPFRKMSGSIDVVATRRITTVSSVSTPDMSDFVEGTEDIKEEPDYEGEYPPAQPHMSQASTTSTSSSTQPPVGIPDFSRPPPGLPPPGIPPPHMGPPPGGSPSFLPNTSAPPPGFGGYPPGVPPPTSVPPPGFDPRGPPPPFYRGPPPYGGPPPPGGGPWDRGGPPSGGPPGSYGPARWAYGREGGPRDSDSDFSDDDDRERRRYKSRERNREKYDSYDREYRSSRDYEYRRDRDRSRSRDRDYDRRRGRDRDRDRDRDKERSRDDDDKHRSRRKHKDDGDDDHKSSKHKKSSKRSKKDKEEDMETSSTSQTEADNKS